MCVFICQVSKTLTLEYIPDKRMLCGEHPYDGEGILNKKKNKNMHVRVGCIGAFLI